jgi:hypothetical protein
VQKKAICAVRIGRVGFGAGRQRSSLERWTTPTLSRRTSSPWYGLQSCKRDWAGVVKRRRESSHLPPLNRPIHTKQTTARGCSPGPCGVPRVHPPGAPACSPAAALPCGRWSIVATPSLLFRWDTSRSGCPPLTLSPPASPRTRTLRDGPGRRAGEELYRPGHHSVLVPPMPPTRLLYACPLSKAPTPRAKHAPGIGPARVAAFEPRAWWQWSPPACASSPRIVFVFPTPRALARTPPPARALCRLRDRPRVKKRRI